LQADQRLRGFTARMLNPGIEVEGFGFERGVTDDAAPLEHLLQMQGSRVEFTEVAIDVSDACQGVQFDFLTLERRGLRAGGTQYRQRLPEVSKFQVRLSAGQQRFGDGLVRA
jgi:hypothetical protein